MSDYPPPLPVRHMTRVDFYGVLFVEFPIERQDWPWERARRELERLIRLIGETEITPATIYSAFFAERQRRLENLPAFAVERMAQAAWKGRRTRQSLRPTARARQNPKGDGADATIPAPRFVENGCPESDPLATRWNRETRRGEFLHPEAAEKQLAANREKFEKLIAPPIAAPAGRPSAGGYAAKAVATKPKAETDWSF